MGIWANKLKNALITGIVMVGLVLPSRSHAGINLSADFWTKYLGAMGFHLESQTVIQPAINVSRNGLYGVLWSNLNRKTGLSEVDYTAGYSRDVKGVGIDVSYLCCDLREQGKARANDNMHEIWLILSKKAGDLTGSLVFTQNLSAGSFPDARGRNFNFGVGYAQKALVSLEGHVHYNDQYFIPESGFSVAQFTLGVPINFEHGLAVTPKAVFQLPLNREYFDRDAKFGVAVSRGF